MSHHDGGAGPRRLPVLPIAQKATAPPAETSEAVADSPKHHTKKEPEMIIITYPIFRHLATIAAIKPALHFCHRSVRAWLA